MTPEEQKLQRVRLEAIELLNVAEAGARVLGACNMAEDFFDKARAWTGIRKPNFSATTLEFAARCCSLAFSDTPVEEAQTIMAWLDEHVFGGGETFELWREALLIHGIWGLAGWKSVLTDLEYHATPDPNKRGEEYAV